MNEQAYAGDVTPNETWEALRDDPSAVLVDVRTKPEWALVGQPDLGQLGKHIVGVQWQIFPQMEVNDGFAAELAAAGIARDQPIYFMCRSGPRSTGAAAAMTQAGFARCYNVLDGFEGPPNEAGQRGQTAGWKADGLAWRQG